MPIAKANAIDLHLSSRQAPKRRATSIAHCIGSSSCPNQLNRNTLQRYVPNSPKTGFTKSEIQRFQECVCVSVCMYVECEYILYVFRAGVMQNVWLAGRANLAGLGRLARPSLPLPLPLPLASQQLWTLSGCHMLLPILQLQNCSQVESQGSLRS